MKTKRQITLLAVVLGLVTGCASSPKPKAVHERGWIGGDFRRATREMRPVGEQATVYLRQTFPNTPSTQAGLQPGDLILALDTQPVSGLRDFHARVDAAQTGQTLQVTVLREGQRIDIPVMVGRERYKKWNNLRVGLALSTQFDLLPDPDFSLISVASFKRETERLEINSPESVLKRNARRSPESDPQALNSKEGWNAWLAVFGVGRHKEILSQETAVPVTAQR